VLPSPDRSHRFRTLLLGDPPGEADPVRDALAVHGVEVRRVGDLAQASDALDRLSPDAVIVDATGPDADAPELCVRLRERIGPRPIPILVLGDCADEDTLERALAAGASDWLAGTGNWSQVAERLARHVANARTRDELASSRRQAQRASDVLATVTRRRTAADAATPDRDALTGLLNRRGFLAAAQRVLGGAEAAPELPVRALVLVNLDRFKRLNDALGASAGDQVLQEVGRRLRQAFRNLDGVAIGRLASDEFALAFPALRTARAAERAADILLTELRRPMQCAGLEFVLRASVGIAIAGGGHDDGSVESLLGLAGRALTAAKLAGGNALRRFEPSLEIGGRERFGLEISLHQALERGELTLYYQPIVEPRSGRIGGVEALTRWRREGRMIPPSKFIPIAEETGMIVRLGEWALVQALQQLRAWRSAGTPVAMVSVNIHARHLEHPDLTRVVADALAVNGIEPAMLELELTETGVMRDIERSLQSMQRLRQLGVRLALDDFGTGYSSLSYLTQLPLDTLKIDGSFVRRLDDGDQSRAVVRTITALAQALGLTTVAECVETREQLDSLRALGCDEVQGYYYARPMPARELPGWWHGFTGGGNSPPQAGGSVFGSGPAGAIFV
jgi:diguanylate cyclase (GGDEF)-like protein